MGWMDQMKPADWINLAQLGTSVAGGVAAGGASQRAAEQAEFDRMRQERADEFNRQLQYYQLQQGARSGLGAFYNQTNQDRASGRQALLNASPLGAEQELVYQMARARGLSGVAENFQPVMPTSADIASLIRPTGNILSAFTTPNFRQAISPEATARSIAERRKALAGVDPTFQFGSMGDYGIPNLEKEVATYAQGVAADRLSRENQLQDLLVQQAKAAAAFPQTIAQAQAPQGVPPTQSAATPKKTSWWKRVVGAALPVAAAFIPGVGPMASMALQAAAGAAGGALTGGKKGALMGAATGAIGAKTGGLGSAAGQRAAGETAKSFVQRAILQPSTLTNVAGKAVGGQTGALLQAASPFLGGITPFSAAPGAGFENQLPPGWQGPQQPLVGPGAEGFSPEFTSPAPGSGSTFTPLSPRRGSVTPPTMGQSTFIQQAPSVTPRLRATKLPSELQQLLEQVGRRRATAADIPATDGLTRAVGISADPSSKATIERNLGLPYYLRGQRPTPALPMGDGPLAAGQPDMMTQVASTPIGMAMLSALGLPFAGAPGAAPLQIGPGAARVAGYLPPAGGPPAPALQLGGALVRAALPSGQYNLPAATATSQKTQLVVADLLDKINRYKDNPAMVRSLITQLQPYLRQVPGVR